MRTINDHVVNPTNDRLKIEVVDEAGQGGANHLYVISGFNTGNNVSARTSLAETSTAILFQNGPINEFGVNGVTHEAILAIVADRLRSFQAGPYACRDNDLALADVENAMLRLQKRTHERMRRGVEGTNNK